MIAGRIVAANTRAKVPRLLEGRLLRGCNVHHSATVFVQSVDLGDLAGRRTGEAGRRFGDRFAARFAGPGDVPFERALLEAILAVELSVARAMRRSDAPAFSRILPDPRSTRSFTLAWESHSASISRAAARAALAGLMELLPVSLTGRRRAQSEAFDALMKKLERRSRRRRWSAGTAALAQAAKDRGVPCEPLAGAYLRLGDGVLQQVVSASGTNEHATLDAFFPAGAPARVPVALVLGERGAGAVARELDGLLRATGREIGLSTRALTTINGRPADPTSLGRRDGARFLLGDPRVEMLVTSASPARVVKRGLRLDRTTVTAILDPIAEGEREVHVRGIDVGVAATTGAVVVAADGPLALRLALTQGRERLVLVSLDGATPAVNRHLAAGGSAALLVLSERGETIELRHANETLATIPVSSLRAKAGRVSERRLRRAMFTTALAFGLGLSGDAIAAAVEKRRFLRR